MDTDLDLMLKDRWYEQEIKLWGIFKTQGRGREGSSRHESECEQRPLGKDVDGEENKLMNG